MDCTTQTELYFLNPEHVATGVDRSQTRRGPLLCLHFISVLLAKNVKQAKREEKKRSRIILDF